MSEVTPLLKKKTIEMLDVVKSMRAGVWVCPTTFALAVSEATGPERWAPTALLPLFPL